MPNITFAFPVHSPNDFQDTPDCFVWTLTDSLREGITKAARIMEECGFSEIHIDTGFHAVDSASDEIMEMVAATELCVVDEDSFNTDITMAVVCDSVVVAGNEFWLRCFDKYTDNALETPIMNLEDVLKATPKDPVAMPCTQ